MICGFIWTYYVSGLMIDLLTMVGILTKLSATYLALTIIAVGNALPDALITIALAKKGQAIMGITGSYAGQLFGLLIGFGLAMLKKSLVDGAPIEFNLFTAWEENLLDLVVVFVTFGTLFVTFFYGALRKMKYDNTLALIMLVFYFTFVAAATVIACKQAYFS